MTQAPTVKRIKNASALFALTLMLSACVHQLESSSGFVKPQISTASTHYVGRQSSVPGVVEFLGIPFAQPPVGDLRWAPPLRYTSAATASGQPKRSFDATSFAPACMQGDHIANWYKGVIESFGGNADKFPTPAVSEDCLFLNIWRPQEVTNADLPVLVFLHGGSNKGGWPYEPNYLGARLAAKGAIVVTIAYRLGVFGFFSHPDLPNANFALLDQVAALRWIQENIADFGGDPNKVGLAGESAGANNIAYLMTMPAASGLFQRAIIQSGGWAVYGTAEKTAVNPLGLEFATAVAGPSSSIEALRQLPAEQILEASEKIYANHFFDPVVDGQTILRPFQESLLEHQLNPADLLIGSNANEARMYLDASASVASWKQDQGLVFDEHKKMRIAQVLNSDAETDQRSRVDLLATSYNYSCPSLMIAKAHIAKGSRSWVYYFNQQRDGELAAEMGVYHGAELPYVFDTHDEWLPTSKADRQLTDSMTEYWLNFVASGNPNQGLHNQSKQVAWLAYEANNGAVQILDKYIRSELHPADELCRVLAK